MSVANEVEPPAKPEGARPRVSLATLMILVLAASLEVAVFVKLRDLESGSVGAHVAALVAIAIALTAVAIGGWRRTRAAQVGLQVSTCCALVLVLLALAEAGWEQVMLYWFQAVFGLTIAMPLAVQGWFHADRLPGWLRVAGEVLFYSGVNLLLVLIGLLLQLFLFQVPGIF